MTKKINHSISHLLQRTVNVSTVTCIAKQKLTERPSVHLFCRVPATFHNQQLEGSLF